MSIVLIALVLIMGGYIGWTIGANDAANCVGADIGSGKMTVKQGIIITCFFGYIHIRKCEKKGNYIHPSFIFIGLPLVGLKAHVSKYSPHSPRKER